MATLMRRLRGKSSKDRPKSKKKRSGLNCLCVGFPENEDNSNKPTTRPIDEEAPESVATESKGTSDTEIAMGKAQSKEILKGDLLRSETKLKKVVSEKLAQEGLMSKRNEEKSLEGSSDTKQEDVKKENDTSNGEVGNTATDVDTGITNVGVNDVESPVRKSKGKRQISNEMSDDSENYESCSEHEDEPVKETIVATQNQEVSNAMTPSDAAKEVNTKDGTDCVDAPSSTKLENQIMQNKDESTSDSSSTDSEVLEGESKNTAGDTVPKENGETKTVHKRKNPLKKIQSKLLDAIHFQNFDSLSPEVCIDLMKSANLKFLSNLNKKLKQNNKAWNEEFLELNGARGLLDLVETLGIRRVTQLSDALLLLECVQCIKTIMNSKMGLAHLVEHGADLNRLVRGRL